MLLIELKKLKDDDTIFEGDLTPEEMEISPDDECVFLNNPVHYRLAVRKQVDSVIAIGKLSFELDCECVRCLKKFKMPIEIDYADFLPLEGEDAISVKDDCIDLTNRVREDILLAYPQHPLCDENCDRLPNSPSQGANCKMGSSAEVSDSFSTWSELDKLEFEKE